MRQVLRFMRGTTASIAAVVLATLASGPALAVEKASERVSHFYGSFSYVVPIEVPGFRGLEPNIALAYSSAGRNGFAGVGWTLTGFSTIERVNPAGGTPAFDATDTYSVNGQMMVACSSGISNSSCTAAGGSHAIEDESYGAIWFDSATNTWTMWNPLGRRTVFSPIMSTGQGTLRWGQTAVIDTKGNTVTYGWSCPTDADCYPASVSYNNYQILIYRDARPDKISFGAFDRVRTMSDRLRSVLVRVGSTPIRLYAVYYQQSPVTGRSLLTDVAQYGKDVSVSATGAPLGGSALPPTRFTYVDDSLGHSFIPTPVTAPPPAPEEAISWTNRVNTYASGGNLQKSGGVANNFDAGASSTRSIASGSGYVEATWSGGSFVFGLSRGDDDATFSDIDFGVYTTVDGGSGALYTAENGTTAGPYPLASGDRLRVEVQTGGVIRYLRNGQVFRTSTRTAVYPLLADASIAEVNTTIFNAVIAGALNTGSKWCDEEGKTSALGDFNGDGRTDEACHINGVGVEVRLSGPEGFLPAATWSSASLGPQWMVADTDGDGKSDLVAFEGYSALFRVARSTGTSFEAPVVWGEAKTYDNGSPVGCHNGGTGVTVVGTGDFNGDGRLDVSCKRVGTDRILVGLSTGTSLNFSLFGRLSCGIYESTGSIDFNGDGKDDWYCIGSDPGPETLNVFPSTGSSFAYPAWGSLTTSQCGGGYTFGDWNGDGRTDVACLGGSTGGNVYLSTGRSWSYAGAAGNTCVAQNAGGQVEQPFAMDVDGDGASELVCNKNGAGAGDIQVRKWVAGAFQPAEAWLENWCAGAASTGDFNADAKPDLYCTTTGSIAYAGSAGVYTDAAKSVVNTLGGTTNVSYGSSAQFPSTNNPGPRPVVTAVTNLDGRGGSSRTSYSYSGAYMDRLNRRFLGFREIVETLQCIQREATCPSTRTVLRQDLAAAGRVERVERNDGTGVKAAQVFEYETRQTVPRYARPSGVWSLEYDDAGGSRRTYSTFQYDVNGNVVQENHHGDYDVAGDEQTRFRYFRPNYSAYVLAAPTQELIRAGIGTSGAVLAFTRYYYDGAGAWDQAPAQGWLTAVQRYLDRPTPKWVTTSIGYDAWGNVVTTTDPTNRTVTKTYDPTFHLYPLANYNAAGELVSTANWDPVCGGLVEQRDANNQVTITTYDAFCRRTRTDAPLGSFVEMSYVGLGNPMSQYVLTETPPASGTQNVQTAVAFDGFGRVWRTVRTGPDGTLSIVQDRTFNARGQVASEGAPRYGADPPKWTAHVFDGLDRRTATILPDQTQIQFTYALGSSSVIDPHGHEVRTLFDALGRRSAEHRWLDGQLVETRYTYDPLGRLTNLHDAEGNQWSWTYDSLGRKVQEQDPDRGTWSYTFDDAGRMSTQTDAKAQVTNFAYDAAGRLRTKTNPDETTTYSYGEARSSYFNAGRLTTVSVPSRETKYDYDALGRTSRFWKTLFGTNYVMQYSYDAGGRLKNVMYPDGEWLGQFAFDAAGRVRSVPGYVSQADYDASGRPLQVAFANGTATTYGYSVRGALTDIDTVGPSGPQGPGVILDLHYGLDAAGMLDHVNSATANESWTYDYDDMHRLTVATNLGNPALSQNWNVDTLGRITYNSQIGTYNYPAAGSARVHAPTDISGDVLSYDANGNMFSGLGRSMTWTADNKPSSINGWQYTYDGLGQRVKKTNGTTTSLYPMEDDYLIENGVPTKYLRVAGLGLIGKKVSGTRYWLHADRLGSVSRVTDASGSIVGSKSYLPYGSAHADSLVPQESKGFIGEFEEAEVGLSYLHARHYDVGTGIFLSPDPLGPVAGLNSYGYVSGNPANLRDPSGLLEDVPEGGHAVTLITCPTPACGSGTDTDDFIWRRGISGGLPVGIIGAIGVLLGGGGGGAAPSSPNPAGPDQPIPPTGGEAGPPAPVPPPVWVPGSPGAGGSGSPATGSVPTQTRGSRLNLNIPFIDLLPKVWAAPASAPGLWYGGAWWLAGQAGWTTQPSVGFGNNAIEFTGVPLPPGILGMTFGNVILYPAGFAPSARTQHHELQHTYQAELLGPLYLPAHMFTGATSFAVSGYTDLFNMLEWGPSQGTPWALRPPPRWRLQAWWQ